MKHRIQNSAYRIQKVGNAHSHEDAVGGAWANIRCRCATLDDRSGDAGGSGRVMGKWTGFSRLETAYSHLFPDVSTQVVDFPLLSRLRVEGVYELRVRSWELRDAAGLVCELQITKALSPLTGLGGLEGALPGPTARALTWQAFGPFGGEPSGAWI